MKKIFKSKSVLIALMLLVSVSLVLAGCGGSGGGGKAEEKKPAAAGGDKVTIKIAYENNPGEPLDLAVKEWARLFKEKTGGKGELQLYPSSQLGSKKDLMEQMKLGSNVITLADGGFFADYVPDFGIMMGPYLGKDYNEVFTITKSDWFKDLSKKLDEKGYHIITTNWLYGTRHMVLNKPVNKLEDFKGLKIRVPNNKIQMESIKALGATPTPMPLGEVYPALTQGVIDGAENPIPVLYGQKLHEKAKYLVLSGHLDNITQWIIGDGYFKKLPPDIQKALVDSGNEAGDFMTKQIAQAEKETIEKMKKEGVTVIEIDRAPLRDATKVVYTLFPEWTPNLYDNVQKIVKK